MVKKDDHLNKVKQQLGKFAARLIKNNTTVGLGSGSTASYFIASLSERVTKEKLDISVIASSAESEKLAVSGGLKMLRATHFSRLDIVIDGADAIDPLHRMIKGKGGAITREKILAQATRDLVIIADKTKCVPVLGNCCLPVEILSFGNTAIQEKIQEKGYLGNLRKDAFNNIFVTDNGNYIFDITYPETFPDPEKDQETLLKINGVIETGFLLQKARIVIGDFEGVRILKEIK